jgi:SAM-dependent methyltransferase
VRHHTITSPADPAFTEIWEQPDVGAFPTILRTIDGEAVAQPIWRWLQPPGADEREALECCVAPVLDVGCGPGRHVVALNDRGKPAVGIDASAAAVAIAARHGAIALRRAVFDRVPGQGQWATALLLDGNIGIGGDPVALLRRLAELLNDRGLIVVEVGPPGSRTHRTTARLEQGAMAGNWFSWAFVSDDGIERLARAAGFTLLRRWSRSDRWFVALARAELSTPAHLDQAAMP